MGAIYGLHSDRKGRKSKGSQIKEGWSLIFIFFKKKFRKGKMKFSNYWINDLSHCNQNWFNCERGR